MAVELYRDKPVWGPLLYSVFRVCDRGDLSGRVNFGFEPRPSKIEALHANKTKLNLWFGQFSSLGGIHI